jgi:hypothetical protein
MESQADEANMNASTLTGTVSEHALKRRGSALKTSQVLYCTAAVPEPGYFDKCIGTLVLQRRSACIKRLALANTVIMNSPLLRSEIG